jgi:O-antigen ligase
MTFQVVRILLLALLLGAPLAFGAVVPWARAGLLVSAFVLLFLWGLGCVRQGFVRLVWSPLYLPAAAFLVLGLVQYVLHRTHDLIGTREVLLLLTTSLIFFFLAGQLMALSSRRTWRWFGWVVTVYGFALALFSILQFFSSQGLIYWVVKSPGMAFGPYVNRNHYAGLIEMLIPLAAGYVLSRPPGYPWRFLLGFTVMVPIVSLLICGSRAGLITLLAELLILSVLLQRWVAGSTRRSLATAAILGVTLAALLFFLVDPGRFSQRLVTIANLTTSPEASLGARRVVTLDSMRMVRDYPLLGIGLGSFRVVYPRYQSFADSSIWDHAHNDYMEALSETGLIGGLLMLAALLLFFRLAFSRVRERMQTETGWIQLGAALGACGLLVHSLFDFNLHIHANAIWFVVCVALATSPVRVEQELAGKGRSSS